MQSNLCLFLRPFACSLGLLLALKSSTPCLMSRAVNPAILLQTELRQPLTYQNGWPKWPLRFRGPMQARPLIETWCLPGILRGFELRASLHTPRPPTLTHRTTSNDQRGHLFASIPFAWASPWQRRLLTSWGQCQKARDA